MNTIFSTFFLSILILGLFMMGGCSNPIDTKNETSPDSQSYILSSQEVSKSSIDNQEANKIKNIIQQERVKLEKAILEMEVLENNETVSIGVFLENPGNTPITSVQSWVSFSSSALQGASVNIPKESPFSFVAPGENAFDNTMGLAKIGVSIPEGKEFTDSTRTLIAILTFEKKQEGMMSFEFFNASDTGKTRVLAMTENGVRNVLNIEKLEQLFLLPSQ